MISVRKVGDWEKAGIYLKRIALNLEPFMKARVMEGGETFLKEIRGHMDRQDLGWTPLSEKTVELKGGDDTIYIESGFLYDGISVRKIKSSKGNISIFVGASPWKTHEPSGLRMSDLMIWLEYGTEKMPARPLIRPTWEEVEPLLKKLWGTELKDFIDRGGSLK